MSVLPAFAPIWAITGLGYLLSRFAVLGDRADQVLTRFAFTVAMPAVVFSTLTSTSFSALVNPGLLAFVAGTAAVGITAAVLSRWVFRRKRGEGVVTGMAACYTNAGNLGIPVALQVLGGSSFIVSVLLIQSLGMMPLMLGLLESDVPRGESSRLRALLMLPVRNPVIAASLLGVLVGTTGLHLPDLLMQPIHTLGNAGVATALLALGMSLNPGKTVVTGEPRRGELTMVVVLKVIAQPLVALGVGLALGLPQPVMLAAVLCSALPTAQNIFIATSQYAIDSRFTRDAVLITTLLSMATLSVIAALLS
ncbi:AEC family transporter [Amycolatopsis sp. cg5]|uniref:AEC family transporter n=1 Tax=Amycolatopsis sp. cg5 TaxID=3238802 RepID=UPI0035254344